MCHLGIRIDARKPPVRRAAPRREILLLPAARAAAADAHAGDELPMCGTAAQVGRSAVSAGGSGVDVEGAFCTASAPRRHIIRAAHGKGSPTS